MRSHHQLGRYLHDLYSPEAEARITEDGARQARLFAEGDDEVRRDEVDALDFDRASAEGPGAALARALRAGGSALKVDDRVPEDSDEQLPVAKVSQSRDSSVTAAADKVPAAPATQDPALPADLRSAVTAPPAVQSTQRQTPLMERVARAKKAVVKDVKVPRSPPVGAIVLVVVLLAAAAVGLVWLLRGG
jgi:cobalamin biosynthesis Mg chelatase CobN